MLAYSLNYDYGDNYDHDDDDDDDDVVVNRYGACMDRRAARPSDEFLVSG